MITWELTLDPLAHLQMFLPKHCAAMLISLSNTEKMQKYKQTNTMTCAKKNRGKTSDPPVHLHMVLSSQISHDCSVHLIVQFIKKNIAKNIFNAFHSEYRSQLKTRSLLNDIYQFLCYHSFHSFNSSLVRQYNLFYFNDSFNAITNLALLVFCYIIGQIY